jgi:murein DD-endopeptidase MepM/ murein hydrolase activator NlpD
MHAGRGSARHFTFEGGKLAMLMSGAMLLAALVGAFLYRGLVPVVLPVAHADVPPRDAQPDHTEEALRLNVGLLAEKVGTLQARLAAIDALGRRLAMAAGVALPDETPASARVVAKARALPETDVALASHDAVAADPAQAEPIAGASDLGPAQAVGRDIDVLADQLTERLASLQVLDITLTRRRADLARLPTSMPVTDYPYLSSSYGWRRHPVTGRYSRHDGLDFAAPRGTPILAAAGGVVLAAGPDAGYGRRVEIDHGDGLMSRYAHASEVLVHPGDLVERGQLIARVGSSGVSTGPHLHFEVRLGGQALDPRLFLGRQPTAPPAVASASVPLVR